MLRLTGAGVNVGADRVGTRRVDGDIFGSDFLYQPENKDIDRTFGGSVIDELTGSAARSRKRRDVFDRTAVPTVLGWHPFLHFGKTQKYADPVSRKHLL